MKCAIKINMDSNRETEGQVKSRRKPSCKYKLSDKQVAGSALDKQLE